MAPTFEGNQHERQPQMNEETEQKTMSIFDATDSSADGPTRLGVYSKIGWGKTTLGCHMPNPIVAGPEKGIPRDLGFSVKEIHPKTWLDHFALVHSLTYDKHPYQSLVYDTADWLEPMIHAFVCERDSERDTETNPRKRKLLHIDDYGFGKGYIAAESEFRKLIGVLDVLQYRRGMHVVFLMHANVRTFKNPSGPDFDRWEPKVHARIAAVIKEWAENFIFGKFQIDASKISEDKERNKQAPERARAKANMGTAPRIVGAQECAEYDAKNRVRLPPEFELQDPNELIDRLLGLHLGSNVQTQFAARTQRDMPKHTPYNGPAPSRVDAAPLRKEQPQPDTRSNGYSGQGSENGPSDWETGHVGGRPAMLEQREQRRDETPHDHLTNAPLGVPAHHETRKADEQTRQDDAFARARGAVDQRDQQRASADPQKTAARNWTEPPQTQTKLGEKEPQDSADIRRMTQAITDAARVSPEFQRKVQAWAKKIHDGNPSPAERTKRLDFICGEVSKELKNKDTGNQAPRA